MLPRRSSFVRMYVPSLLLPFDQLLEMNELMLLRVRLYL
jgi:hypothetical protein